MAPRSFFRNSSPISTHLKSDRQHRLKAKSQDRNVDATRAQILLEVDNAYFATLRNQALVRVAQDTVTERRLLRNQVDALAQNELRSASM